MQKVKTREASLVLIVMLAILGTGVIKWGLSPQTPVLLVLGLLTIWAKIRGFSWQAINDGIKSGIETGIIPIFIFILVGALISVWIAAGIIPTLMLVGFKMISVNWFIPSVFVVCALVGTAVGSAFTVMSTVGIAFFGMGMTMGINPALVAGAIISGAVFGDKCSPLSESTNLSAAVVDADLFDHIRNLMWSTLPDFVGALILFAIFGAGDAQNADISKIQHTESVLQAHFATGWWVLIPIILMFVCAWRRVPAVPTLFINIGVSVGLIWLEHPATSVQHLAKIIETGYVAHTGNLEVDQLLSRGGIASMMTTVSLIVVTLSLGGVLVHLGLINQVMEPIARVLNSDGKLILAVVLSAMGANLLIGEQFLSVILPGKAFKATFKKAGLANVALSRALEDGGTVINYLVPWGVAATFAANTFHVATLDYLPFAFFSLLSPVFSILSGFTGIGLKRSKASSDQTQP